MPQSQTVPHQARTHPHPGPEAWVEEQGPTAEEQDHPVEATARGGLAAAGGGSSSFLPHPKMKEERKKTPRSRKKRRRTYSSYETVPAQHQTQKGVKVATQKTQIPLVTWQGSVKDQASTSLARKDAPPTT